ncbi:unnamed protein product [Notodromas monacha]|uniref:VWFC domain-containing protein n=1 Tax=Notodromas monacha TaxID=399045 RepID=A0A7R9BQ67_9CRUS|nr:unnamed protein product [Notodromas monacha]CAG0919603.1 unnamed protein product [Notodromas monacha]
MRQRSAFQVPLHLSRFATDDAPAEDASSGSSRRGNTRQPPPPASAIMPTITPSLISVAPTAVPSSPGGRDCVSGGRRFAPGSQWHPVIGPFGEMECVECACEGGQISCHRLHCPSAQDLGCAPQDLVKVPGHCCPTCPEDYGIIVAPLMPHADDSRARSREESSRNNAQGLSHEQAQPPPVQESKTTEKTGPNIKTCAPAGTDVIAYLLTNVNPNGSVSVTYIFYKKDPKPFSKPIERHKWTWEKSVGSHKMEPHRFETFYEGIEALQELKEDLSLNILGATSTKYLERFTKKEKKVDSGCEKRCQRRIRKMETFLNLRPVNYRRQCLDTETTLS